MNKAIVIGNLGADPEVRHTQNSTPVATFSIATTERWKDTEGSPQEAVEWHRIVVWNRLAEIAGEYLKKGSKVCIEGKMQTRKYQKDGTDRYVTEIIGKSMEMLSSRRDDSDAESYSDPDPTPGGSEEVPF